MDYKPETRAYDKYLMARFLWLAFNQPKPKAADFVPIDNPLHPNYFEWEHWREWDFYG